MLQDVISFAFVGHIDKTSLSCMTLAGTMFNLSGLSLVMGLASGAETLSGQVSLHRVMRRQAQQPCALPVSKFCLVQQSGLPYIQVELNITVIPIPQSPKSHSPWSVLLNMASVCSVLELRTTGHWG